MTWHDHNRSMWRQNHWDLFQDLAREGALERLERLLVPLRGNHAELLVQKAEGDRKEFSKALHSTVLDYDLAMQEMFTATRDQRALLAMVCDWCGEQSCQDREQHRRLNAQRETTWRESSAAGAALPSQEPSAAADGAAGSLPPCGPAAPLSLEGGAGADTGRSVPARGDAWYTAQEFIEQFTEPTGGA